MKNGMSLDALLAEVKRQSEVKRDFVASTKDAVRMVDSEGQLWIVLLKDGAGELERFEITENAHRQIADRLQIPWRYYDRLMQDHKDLVLSQVNALFEREPAARMLRILDGKVRAFLSDRYRRFDNDELLMASLPPIVKGDVPSVLLSSHVNENNMYLKILFTDDDLAIDMGDIPKPGQGRLVQTSAHPGHEIFQQDRASGRDIVRPGMIIGNSETGMGSTRFEGFLFRGYCVNGAVFGTESAWTYQRQHVGGKLSADENFQVFSESTRRAEDELTIAQMQDAVKAMSSRESVEYMARQLKALKETGTVSNPRAAIDQLAKELIDVREGEKDGILESFIRDGDYSQWGMMNAVTEQANREDISYERACEIEKLGQKIAQMALPVWNRVRTAEAVAA